MRSALHAPCITFLLTSRKPARKGETLSITTTIGGQISEHHANDEP